MGNINTDTVRHSRHQELEKALDTGSVVQLTRDELREIQSAAASGKRVNEFAAEVNSRKDLRVVLLGESHDDADPSRDFNKRLVAALEKGSFSHLAIEADGTDPVLRAQLERFNKGEISARELSDALPPLLRQDNYFDTLERARERGMQVVAIDHLQSTGTGDRDQNMAANIGNILRDDPNARVIFIVGEAHISDFYDHEAPSVSTHLERQLGDPAVLSVTPLRTRRTGASPMENAVSQSFSWRDVVVNAEGISVPRNARSDTPDLKWTEFLYVPPPK
jgi:uncharacterized iron-regulated protein